VSKAGVFWVYYEEMESNDFDIAEVSKTLLKTHKKVLEKILKVEKADRFKLIKDEDKWYAWPPAPVLKLIL